MTEPDFQPTLIGPSVTVRPMSASDWPQLFAAAADPEIWKVHPVPDRYTEPVFRKFFDGAIETKKAFVFVDRASNRLIGASRYHDYNPQESEIEIVWTVLARCNWDGATHGEVNRMMLI